MYTHYTTHTNHTIYTCLYREEKIARGKFDMELSEIKHGRLAMLAITAFAAQVHIYCLLYHSLLYCTVLYCLLYCLL